MKILKLLLFFSIQFCNPVLSEAAEIPDTLVMAIHHFPPCVINDEGKYSGFDIDLWEEIAGELKITTIYNHVDFDSLFEMLVDRRVDIAMAGITINAEREEIIDFSNHYLDSGLRIMILSDDKSGILRKIRNFFTPGVIKGFIAMLLFILLCGQLLWISEHGKDAINDRYFPGIFESFWCVITTMTTVGYGDIAPQKWLGRIAASMVMLTGIGLFGFIIGEFTAATAIQKMENIINSPHDLARKNVATVRSTTSVKTLNDIGARVIEVDTPEDAQKLLLKKKVEAVVFDSPVLQNFVKRDIEGRLVLTGGMFDKQYYGIAFPQNSELRELVNRALLKIQTKIHGVSRFDLIYSKWFMD